MLVLEKFFVVEMTWEPGLAGPVKAGRTFREEAPGHAETGKCVEVRGSESRCWLRDGV